MQYYYNSHNGSIYGLSHWWLVSHNHCMYQSHNAKNETTKWTIFIERAWQMMDPVSYVWSILTQTRIILSFWKLLPVGYTTISLWSRGHNLFLGFWGRYPHEMMMYRWQYFMPLQLTWYARVQYCTALTTKMKWKWVNL